MSIRFVFLTIFLVCVISSVFAGGHGGHGGSIPSSINSPIFSHHVVKIKNIPSKSSSASIPTIVINSAAMQMPIKMVSSSSDVQISQEHNNAGPQVLNSHSVDGEIVLNQFVKKPILQNVREVIIPRRKIVQEVLPVKEFIKTIVAQDSGASGTSAPMDDSMYDDSDY